MENTLSESSLKWLMAKGNIVYDCQLTCERSGPEKPLNNSKEVNKILPQFDYLFSDPAGMPPERKRNHRTVLNPHTAPINIHPYRYPRFQKNEIETNEGNVEPWVDLADLQPFFFTGTARPQERRIVAILRWLQSPQHRYSLRQVSHSNYGWIDWWAARVRLLLKIGYPHQVSPNPDWTRGCT